MAEEKRDSIAIEVYAAPDATYVAVMHEGGKYIALPFARALLCSEPSRSNGGAQTLDKTVGGKDERHGRNATRDTS